MPNWLSSAIALSVVVVTAGCVGMTAPAVSSGAARPISDTPTTTPQQARAKISVDLGMAYFEVGRFDVALDEAQTALKHDSSYPPAYHLLGLIYMYLENLPSARENFIRAISAAPQDPEFNNSYGWFQCANGEEAEGLQRLAAAARNPYYRFPSRAYTNAGLCYLLLKDDVSAMEQFRRAVTLDPSNAQAQFVLASLYYRAGDYEQARQRLVDLHQRNDPTAASVWLGVRTERKLGNQTAAASYAAQLRGRFSDSTEYQTMMQGNFE